MKKLILSLSLIFSLVLPMFAKAPLSYIPTGSWGFYTDNREAKEIYRGFLVINNDEEDLSQVYLRVVTNPKKPKTDIHFVIDVLYGEDKEPVIGNVYNVQGFTKETLDDNTIIQSALDILNFDIMYRNNIKKIGYDTLLEDPWGENFVQIFHFNKALPLFHFDYICEKGYDGEYIRMDRYGLASSEADINNFFKMTKSNLKAKDSKIDFAFDAAKAQKVKLSGITYQIDENWVYAPATEEFTESYVLSKYTNRDASIVVEDLSSQMSFKTVEDMEFLCAILIATNDSILLDTIKASYAGKNLTLSFVAVDKNNENFKTIEFFKITPKGKIIELFTFEKCYEDNKEYFDKILQNAK